MFLALVSRVGFIFIEVGSIPVENVYTIVLYNLFEISVGILLYGLVGNLIAFRRHTAIGWISLDRWRRWKWDDVSSMTRDTEAALLGILMGVTNCRRTFFLIFSQNFDLKNKKIDIFKVSAVFCFQLRKCHLLLSEESIWRVECY